MSDIPKNNAETLTQEAADRMADDFVQALLALAQGDGEGRDAEVAKMRQMLDNPRGREADAR